MKNNKGFMMAEVIVVAAVVLSVLSTLYISYGKIYSAYKTRINYYDSTLLYKLAYYRDVLIDNGKINGLLETNKTEKITAIDSMDSGDTVFLIYNRKKNIDKNIFGTRSVHLTYKDYINFLFDSADLKSNHVMIIESCPDDGDNCKYAYLEVYDGYE